MRLVLASKSPRRQTLLKELGFPVEIRLKEVEEDYPDLMNPRLVPEFLAKKKAEPLIPSIVEDELLITSDTVVLFQNKLLEKPTDKDHAKRMLTLLSGNSHTVVTGVAINSSNKSFSFSSETIVNFAQLSEDEIDHYIDKCEPYDKAGSYGIQEWIGYIGVKGIEGCYYNVMGLPLHDLYQTIKKEFQFKAELR